MVRSTSCFKIMTCGGGDPSKDNDDQLDVPEVKSDRRRWSFQKRSSRHKVLSNSVLSASPVENKEIPECVDADTKATTDFDDVEKVSTIPCAIEKPQLSAPPEVKTPETAVETKIDIVKDEASIVIIQAGIRAYMAQKKLLKLRKVIKVQALVRGHLVRRHAVGTLRCVQAIVKMQALVRTRYASRLVEVSNIEKTAEAKEMGKETHMERLLDNRFAQQILESKPKKKPIHIKCDTSKTDSAWQWLERWMSVSSSKQSPSMEASNEERVGEVNEEIAVDGGMGLTSEVVRPQPMSCHGDTDSVTADGGADALASAVKDTEFIPLQPTSSPGDTADSVTADGGGDTLAKAVKDPEIDETPDVNENIMLQETENPITSNEISNAELNDAIDVSVDPEGDIEQPRHSEQSIAPAQLVTDLREPSIGSGIDNNPELTAALSKFKEMTPDTMSSDPVISSYEDVVPVATEEVDRSTDVSAENQLKDNSTSDKLLAITGGSECGTELSISSTLDSPDRDEHAEKGNQSQIPDDEAFKTDGVEHLEDEVHTDHPEEGVDSISKVDNAIVVAEAVKADEHEIGKPTPDLDTEVTAEATPQHNLQSPETSPRSLMTVLESQGTPASQASVNTKGNGAVKSILSHKRKSFSAGKRSPSSPKQESASSNSKELPRDRKTTRRRALKPEDADQEPRESNSNSTGSIPHFMQATESARAKLNANNSPRSSPDVHDRELTTKKKRSPHARQHSGKANDTQQQERKWIR